MRGEITAANFTPTAHILIESEDFYPTPPNAWSAGQISSERVKIWAPWAQKVARPHPGLLPPGEGEGETSAAGLTDRGGFGGWGGESGICRTYGAGGSVGNAYYRYDAPTELGKGAISAEKM